MGEELKNNEIFIIGGGIEPIKLDTANFDEEEFEEKIENLGMDINQEEMDELKRLAYASPFTLELAGNALKQLIKQLRPTITSLEEILKMFRFEGKESKYIKNYKFYDSNKKYKSQVNNNRLAYVRCRNNL